VVSRQRLGEVLREQWLQHRGSFEEASSVRLGRMVGARYLLSGLYYVGGNDLVLDVHLLDVEQGAVIRTIRVTGSPEAIPDLELDLASRLGGLFDAAVVSQPGESKRSSPFEEDTPDVQFDAQAIRDIQNKIGEQGPLSRNTAPLSTTLRVDTVLGLERLRRIRDRAAQMAQELWTRALSIRLGALRYGGQPEEDTSPGTVTVHVPLTATFREEAVRKLDAELVVSTDDQDTQATEMVLGFKDPDPGAKRLFLEALQSPQRVFVRAVQESGNVLALSSQWGWRTDLHLRTRPDGMVIVPRSSLPFLKGNAPFGETLLINQDSTLTFDAVVVPVPQERRSISVEFVDNQHEVKNPSLEHEELLASMQPWLLHRWFPPVAESIPTSGYLPGNRRRGVALVSMRGGTVSSFQVVHVDEEERFAESITHVLRKLPGECFHRCKMAQPPDVPPPSFSLRVQFELVKDIRYAGLGRTK